MKLEDIMAARVRIQPLTHQTPLVYSSSLSHRLGCDIYIKCENQQKTGSFKARGVSHFLSTDMSGANTVTTYSSGNHGQALAWGAAHMNRKSIIFMPEDASPVKVAAVRGYGGEVRFAGRSSADRYKACKAFADESGALIVPPYDHEAIIAGQGTAMLEVLEVLPEPDVVLIPVGGGGLLAGNALAGTSLRQHLEIYACEPELAADVKASLDSGTLQSIAYPPTIADGLRNLRLGDRNWDIVSKRVEGGLTCKEETIRRAMAAYACFTKQYVEPSGAVTLACLWQHAHRFQGKTVVLYLSGGNIAPWDYAKLVTEDVGTFE